jgi:uncharacterized membrane protein
MITLNMPPIYATPAHFFPFPLKNKEAEMLHGIKVYFATLPIFLAVVYLCIPLGIILFVLPRIPSTNIFPSALIWGGLYGFVLYAVYDMTNYALVARWPLKMSIVDICWGIFICSTVSTVAAYFDRWIR